MAIVEQKSFFQASKKWLFLSIVLVLVVVAIGFAWFSSKDGYDARNREYWKEASSLTALQAEIEQFRFSPTSLNPGIAWKFAADYREKSSILQARVDALQRGQGTFIFFSQAAGIRAEEYRKSLNKWQELTAEIEQARSGLAGFDTESQKQITSAINFRTELAGKISDRADLKALAAWHSQINPWIAELQGVLARFDKLKENAQGKSLQKAVIDSYEKISQVQLEVFRGASKALEDAARFLETYTINLQQTLAANQNLLGNLSMLADRLAPLVNEAVSGVAIITREMNQHRQLINVAASLDPSIRTAVNFIDGLERTLSTIQSEVREIQQKVAPLNSLFTGFRADPQNRELQGRIVNESRSAASYFNSKSGIFDPVINALDTGISHLNSIANYRGGSSSGRSGRGGVLGNLLGQAATASNPLPRMAQTGIRALESSKQPFIRGKQAIAGLGETFGNIGSAEERYLQRLREIREMLVKENKPFAVSLGGGAGMAYAYPGADWKLFGLAAGGLLLAVPLIFLGLKVGRERHLRPVAKIITDQEKIDPVFTSSRVKMPGLSLFFTAGDLQGQSIELGNRPENFIIGRDPAEANLVVMDKTISRKHLKIEYDPAGNTVIVQDLGSSFGTRIDGVSLIPYVSTQIERGSEVSAGQGLGCRFRLRECTGSVAVNRQVSLVGMTGPLTGQLIPLPDNQRIVMGRDPEHARLVIDHPMVSRQHLVLRAQDGGLWIEDLNSSHGVYVDGQPIESGGRLFLDRNGQQFSLGRDGSGFRLEIK